MNRQNHLWACVVLAALTCWAPAPVRAGESQPVVGGKGFKFSEYYAAPYETQMRWLMECSQAQRQPDKRILVTQAKYQTFRATGEGELVVEAPECVYDPDGRTISSSGPLRTQTADGSFTIEGEGFLWQQTNSTLMVSNRVHTTLHPEMFRPVPAGAPTNRPAPEGAGIEVYSDRFEYEQITGRGAYDGNVRVTGTDLTATAGRLVVLMPLAEHRLQSIIAEDNVVVDYENIHATGGWAFYSEDTGLVQMKDHPTWRIEQREGNGDELVFDRTNRVFSATGHARLQMPAAGMGGAAFLAQAGAAVTNSLPSTNHLVEVLCDRYVLQTNLAVFRKDVRVTDRRGEEPQGQMTCGLMTLTFAGTNQLDTLIAEQEVVIAETDRQFTAARAEYTATNSLLDLTGNPSWRTGLREGKGNRIRMSLAQQEMLVQGNAVMKLPAGEVGRSTLAGFGATKAATPREEPSGFAEIHAREYLVTPASALFQGGVTVEHPQMRWECEELTMLSPPELGKDGRLIIAEPDVVFDVLDDQGRTFHGTGHKAVYTHRITTTVTNDVMQLTGSPAVLSTTNFIGRNKIITLDLTKHTVVVPGKWQAEGSMPGSKTNLFLPARPGSSG